MSEAAVAHNSPEDLTNFYAFVDRDGGVQLGFLLGWNTQEGLDAVKESLYSVVTGIADAVHGDLGHWDFEMIRELVDGQVLTQIAFSCPEGSYIFLRDTGVLSNTLDALKAATASGKIEDFKIQLDLVSPDPKTVRLLHFFGELTGDMS